MSSHYKIKIQFKANQLNSIQITSKIQTKNAINPTYNHENKQASIYH